MITLEITPSGVSPAASESAKANNFRSAFLPPARNTNLGWGAIAALLLALGGCGGGGGSSSNDGSQSSSAQVDRVSLIASGPTVPVPSNSITYIDFVVANPGTSTASNVALAVTLGSGLTESGLHCSASGGAACPADEQSTTVALLPAGGTLKYTVAVIVVAGATGMVTCSGLVTASNDDVTSNNSAQFSVAAYSADVRVLGSVTAGDFKADSTITYFYTVENAGPDTARNVTLNQTASSSQAITSITCVASNGAMCPDTSNVNMSVPTLPSAGTLKFVVTTRLKTDVLVSASASLKATLSGDAVGTNNRATVSAKTRIPTSPGSPTFVELQSDVGDSVGTAFATGGDFSFTGQNSVVQVSATQGQLAIDIKGDKHWSGLFYMSPSLQKIERGEYFMPLGVHTQPYGTFSVHGPGTACELEGWFIIDDVTYGQEGLSSLDLRFEQHCHGFEPALRGQVHWVAGDETRPPGPVNPPPPGLWNAPAGITPADGNYVYLESDAEDFIGQGRTELFTQVNSVLSVQQESGSLSFSAQGDRNYQGTFRAMTPLTRVEAGYYGAAQAWRSGNPTVGTFTVSGDGRGCNSSGWFVIDSISFSGDNVTGVDLRFEQHCDGKAAALHGKVHWRSDDPTVPNGPQMPPPAGLWTPPAQAIPATGNVVYLKSDRGDFVGQGLEKTYTPLDSVIKVGDVGMGSVGNRFDLAVYGDEEWTGFFQAMYTLPDLQVGYYGNLLDFPFGNSAYGSISWYGEGRACGSATGWFVIDSITYSGSSVSAIELRFEQRCGVSTAALHGYIRWSAADLRTPPPPQYPPPAGLWVPPSGATPTTGNYLYFQSDPDDYIGKGQTHLFKTPATTFEVTTEGSYLGVILQEADFWGGYFRAMVPLTELQVGYYGGLTEKNIAKGSLKWYGNGRACSVAEAWFVVDNVQYVSGVLSAIDLRFEQRCSGFTGSFRSKFHWRSGG